MTKRRFINEIMPELNNELTLNVYIVKNKSHALSLKFCESLFSRKMIEGGGHEYIPFLFRRSRSLNGSRALICVTD